MYNLKLGMSINAQFGISFEDQLRLLKQTGFESFFHYWTAPNGEVARLKALADELGLDFHSLHAPGRRANALWEEGVTTDAHLLELRLCLQDCIDNHIPVMVMHATATFDYPAPTETGLRNFESLLRMAEGTDTKIAIENLQCEEFHGALLRHFKGHPNFGFCWDTGHEIAYLLPDQMSQFGDQIIYTHFHDNLGTKDFNGHLTGLDDLHLLPFDGIADWPAIAKALAVSSYTGPLTFEVKIQNQRGRHEHDGYLAMPIEQYFAECYKRACRVGALYLRAKAKLG